MNTTIRKGGHVLLSFFSFFREETKDPRARKIELTLLFLIGVLIGAIGKNMIGPFITIGYDDYLVSDRQHTLDLNALQKDFITSGESLDITQDQGGSCTQ